MDDAFIPLSFSEDGYSIRTLVTNEEYADSYHLRHQVFAETLGWVEVNSDGLERDCYDEAAVAMGLFAPSGALVGTLRLISPESGFMLAREFRALLPRRYRFENARQSMEVSRLAVRATNPALRRWHARLLYKGLYLWCALNDVRYNYIVVRPAYLRSLQRIGIPCETIGPAKFLPPANVKSVAAVIDWDRLGSGPHMKQPSTSGWMFVAANNGHCRAKQPPPDC